MKYTVAITEKLIKRVVVEADFIEEAEGKVRDIYRVGKIILDSDDYEDVDFECTREANEYDIANYIDVEDL